MKKNVKRILILTALIITVILSSVILAIYSEYTRTMPSQELVSVQIPMGASEKTIASLLKDNGVIKYELSFRIKMKNSPYRGMLKYGNYTLNKNMPLDDIIEVITKPSAIGNEGIKVTIPEGFSVEMIALRCEEMGLVFQEEFLTELEKGDFQYDFIKEIPQNPDVKYKLQGYLFPSTYMIGENESAHEIIDKMLSEFQKQYSRVKNMLPEGMTMAEAINRAALIEREAKLDGEREIISGVMENRLRINMALQMDASAVYVVSDGLYDMNRVFKKNLQVDSPYNTYKYTGLPAGPICNPGIESIVAAMNPAEHKYLYYHTDNEKNDGSHIFSENLNDHNNSR